MAENVIVISVDTRAEADRRRWSDAARSAMDAGLAEAQPALPVLERILVVDGVPVGRFRARRYYCEGRAQLRPLTDAERALPPVQAGVGREYGPPYLWLLAAPDGRRWVWNQASGEVGPAQAFAGAGRQS